MIIQDLCSDIFVQTSLVIKILKPVTLFVSVRRSSGRKYSEINLIRLVGTQKSIRVVLLAEAKHAQRLFTDLRILSASF